MCVPRRCSKLHPRDRAVLLRGRCRARRLAARGLRRRDGIAFIAHAKGDLDDVAEALRHGLAARRLPGHAGAGGGHAVLKWVTSFPATRPRGLPTVTGSCCSPIRRPAACRDARCGGRHGAANGGGSGHRGGEPLPLRARNDSRDRLRRQRRRDRTHVPGARQRRAPLGHDPRARRSSPIALARRSPRRSRRRSRATSSSPSPPGAISSTRRAPSATGSTCR